MFNFAMFEGFSDELQKLAEVQVVRRAQEGDRQVAGPLPKRKKPTGQKAAAPEAKPPTLAEIIEKRRSDKPHPTPKPGSIVEQLTDENLAKVKKERQAAHKAKLNAPATPPVPPVKNSKTPKPHGGGGGGRVARSSMSKGTKIGLGVGAGVAAAGLGGYLYHQHQKFKEMG